MKYPSRKKTTSELRQDPVSGDWVVIATARSKRPHRFAAIKKKEKIPPKSTCPFEDPQKRGHEVPSLMVDRDGKELSYSAEKKLDWFLQILPNKYPAFGRGNCSLLHHVGVYRWLEGAGFHDIVVFRGHDEQLWNFSKREFSVLLKAYQERYRQLVQEDCVEYILIMHNHGRAAGASLYHPHSQILAVPVIPPDVGRSLRGSEEYYKRNRSCVHCAMIAAERKHRKRVIYENREMIVLAPFASKIAFEVRIFPKKHSYAFERISDEERGFAADAMRVALAKLKKGLNEPAYNFFLHTAPTRPDYFKFYHWHIEILPKTSIWAGFELGTGIEISSVTPEAAAAYLRKVKA